MRPAYVKQLPAIPMGATPDASTLRNPPASMKGVRSPRSAAQIAGAPANPSMLRGSLPGSPFKRDNGSAEPMPQVSQRVRAASVDILHGRPPSGHPAPDVLRHANSTPVLNRTLPGQAGITSPLPFALPPPRAQETLPTSHQTAKTEPVTREMLTHLSTLMVAIGGGLSELGLHVEAVATIVREAQLQARDLGKKVTAIATQYKDEPASITGLTAQAKVGLLNLAHDLQAVLEPHLPAEPTPGASGIPANVAPTLAATTTMVADVVEQANLASRTLSNILVDLHRRGVLAHSQDQRDMIAGAPGPAESGARQDGSENLPASGEYLAGSGHGSSRQQLDSRASATILPANADSLRQSWGLTKAVTGKIRQAQERLSGRFTAHPATAPASDTRGQAADSPLPAKRPGSGRQTVAEGKIGVYKVPDKPVPRSRLPETGVARNSPARKAGVSASAQGETKIVHPPRSPLPASASTSTWPSTSASASASASVVAPFEEESLSDFARAIEALLDFDVEISSAPAAAIPPSNHLQGM